MTEAYIKNDKQLFFNQIRGVIQELNDGEEFCSLTLSVGHENNRNVNLVLKKPLFDQLMHNYQIGEKVSVRFYISSRNKHERWYTTATVLDIQKEN